MLKKTITYEDLDGNSVTKDFYFNLSKAELAEMSLTSESGGGLADEIRKIQATQDVNLIVKSFKTILSLAVGRREGDRFIKDDETRSAFMDTEAYGELFMELVTDAGKAVDFLKGVIPSNVKALVEEKIAHDGLTVEGWTEPVRKVETITTDLRMDEAAVVAPISPADPADAPAKKLSDYTRAELIEMPGEQFDALAGTDVRTMSKALLSIAMARRAAEK